MNNDSVHTYISYTPPQVVLRPSILAKYLTLGDISAFINMLISAVEQCKSNLTFFNDPADKMVVYINVFDTGIILVISSKYNSKLVVRKEDGSVKLDMKNLRNKRAKLLLNMSHHIKYMV